MSRAERTLDVADGAMLAVVVIWAVNNVGVKHALAELAPLPFVLGRFVIVVALLFAWLGIRRRLTLPARADLPLFLLSGVSGFAVYNALFHVGLSRTTSFSTALLVNLGPIFTLLFATLLGIERARAAQWIGVAVAVLGVAVFIGDKLAATGAHWASAGGDLLAVLASAAFAVYSLAAKPLVTRYGAVAVTAWSALVGLVVIAPVAWPAAQIQDWGAVSVGAWSGLVYAAAVSMLIAYSVWGWAIARRGVGRTVPYLFLVPIATAVLAALVLGERFGPVKIAGALLVLLGTAIVRLIGGWAPTAQATAKPAAALAPAARDVETRLVDRQPG